METATKMLLLVLCVDMLLLFGQLTTASLSEQLGISHNLTFMSENSSISGLDAGGYQMNYTDVEDKLIEPTAAVDENTGNFFTDTLRSIKSWFVDNIPGLNYLLVIIGGPATFVARIPGVPLWFSFGIGAVWFSLTLFTIVLLIAGRNT